jgi:plasmid stabilization system protein ParE
MAAKAVEFHQEASAEYEEAFDWYFTRSQPAASKFAIEIGHTIGMIAEGPQRWPAGFYGTRKFLLHRFPFVVIYRELSSAIQVLAVAHCHRLPGYWRTCI